MYAAEEELGGYVDEAASDSGDAALDMLQSSIPGVPGEDYPIYSEVPETAFACDGQVDGGRSCEILPPNKNSFTSRQKDIAFGVKSNVREKLAKTVSQ